MKTSEQTIPYSHHYRCFPQMVGSVANQAVFMYLMDEYLFRLKTGQITEFVVSVNEIAQKRNVNWRTVTKSLDELQTMQLITIQDRDVTIHSDRYIALISAFNTLTKTADKATFIKSLQCGDYVNLHKLGYNEIAGSGEALLFQEGGPANQELCKNAEPYVKIHNPEEEGLCKNTEGYVNMQNPEGEGLCKNAEPYVKIHNPEGIGLCKNTQPSAKIHNPLQKYTTLCKNTEGYVKIHKVLQKYISILDEIRDEVMYFYTREEFIGEFQEYFLEFLTEEELENLMNAIFGGLESENVVLEMDLVFFLHLWGYVKIQKGLCKNTEGVLQKYITVNKYKRNNNKESRNNEIIPPKEKEKEDFFELDKEGLGQSISSYKNFKKKALLPFFPVNEVEEYISDIRTCLDRADKIYINQVWEIAHECLDQEAVYDEDGKEQFPADNDIENLGIMKERLMKDILLPAFEKTQEIVEAGNIVINGEEYPVTAIIEHPEDFENIIDWELQTLLDGDNYIVSTKRVRNIFGDQEEPISSRSVKRDNREDDMTYMQKIVLIGDDDHAYSQLTPIELVIYNFLNDHFVINELLGTIEEPNKTFVARTPLALFYADAKGKGVTEQDFLSVLSKDKPDATGCLNLRQRMFSAERIRQWNRLHSVNSIVDEYQTTQNTQV